MRTARLRNWRPAITAITASLLMLAPLMAHAADSPAFSAYAMRPLPGSVVTTQQSWGLPFASQTWNDLNETEPGTGATFAYQTWFQKDLGSTLYSTTPPLKLAQVDPFELRGVVVVRDRAGSRVLDASNLNQGGYIRPIYHLFANGTALYHQDGANSNAELLNIPYALPTPAGIEAFMKGIKIHGIVRDNSARGDLAMTQLMSACNARMLSSARDGKGSKSRQLIYAIEASEFDKKLGYQYLKIWVRVGDFKILRTELSMVGGTERTDYSNVMDGVRFDDTMFLLPGETVADLP